MPTGCEYVGLSPFYQGAAGAIQQESTFLTRSRTVSCHHLHHPWHGSHPLGFDIPRCTSHSTKEPVSGNRALLYLASPEPGDLWTDVLPAWQLFFVFATAITIIHSFLDHHESPLTRLYPGGWSRIRAKVLSTNQRGLKGVDGRSKRRPLNLIVFRPIPQILPQNSRLFLFVSFAKLACKGITQRSKYKAYVLPATTKPLDRLGSIPSQPVLN